MIFSFDIRFMLKVFDFYSYKYVARFISLLLFTKLIFQSKDVAKKVRSRMFLEKTT